MTNINFFAVRMASIRRDEGENSFLSQLESARIELRDKFSRAHKLLQEREEAIFRQLQEIENIYIEQHLRQNEQRKELLATKEQLHSSLKGNENQTILLSMLAPLEAKLKGLEEGGEGLQRIELNWNREEQLENFLKEICTVKFLTKSNIDYTNKNKPVLVACKYRPNTSKDGKFKYPTVVAIDSKTNNIYIGDETNNRIQVFNESCEFIFSFSENMNMPAGICFHKSQIYVTQYCSHAVNTYSTNGEFIISKGNKGNKQLQFDCPFGICSSELNNSLYICDRNNNRVQILNPDLSFNSFVLGLINPRDVKVAREEILVLDSQNPCIHVYNSEHELMRELISYGNAECQVSYSLHFCIDRDSNILFTDFSTCCVLIFTRGGKLIHKFGNKGKNAGGFFDPRGIAIDSKERIIVASRNPDHCIQFF